MNWQAQDNKQYRGKIDRIYVSATEHYEANYFIEHYLKTRGFGVTDENKKAIGGWMEQYPGHAPIHRDQLNAWLDARTNPTRR